MSPRLRWLLVLTALAAVAVARPTADSGEPEEESGELSSAVASAAAAATGPAVMAVPVRMLTDTDSPFGQVMRGWLNTMPDSDLSVLESGLSSGTGTGTGADEEMMMGDMASADANDGQLEPQSSSPANVPYSQVTLPPDDTDIVLANRESPDSEDTEDSNKKLRLKTIQNQIINYMGWFNRSPSPSPMIKSHPGSSEPITSIQQRDAMRLLYENVNNFPSYPGDTFTEKTQSFYPICDLPKHTNEEVWNGQESMNLMFNVSLHKVSSDISVNVNTAKLRLFKQLVICNSKTSNETEDFQNCQPVLLEDTFKRTNSNMSVSAVVPLILEDKQIRVSIYAYTRTLKKKRVKRKLLDCRMLPYYGEKWTEWNIRSAVKTWRRDPNRNYGLSVEVEDEDGNVLPALKFFRPMNCTGDAPIVTPKPIPGFLMEAIHYRSYNLTGAEGNPNSTSPAAAIQAFNFNIVHRYPMIDVTTVEVPDSEAQNTMLYQYARNTFEQNLAVKASQSGVSKPDDQGAEHRIRHNSRHKGNSTEMPGMKISHDGREFRDMIINMGVVQKAPSTTKAFPTEIPG